MSMTAKEGEFIMNQNMLLPGTLYKNFEGNIYQIMCIAI